MIFYSCRAEDEDKRTFEPGTIPNPDIQHTWNQLAHRSLNPLTEEDPPAYPLADYIMDLITPPKYLQNDSVDKSIDRLVQLFKLDEKSVVKTILAVADKSVSINEKSNDTGYSTQAPSQNNDPPSQMDVDLDALVSNYSSNNNITLFFNDKCIFFFISV